MSSYYTALSSEHLSDTPSKSASQKSLVSRLGKGGHFRPANALSRICIEMFPSHSALPLSSPLTCPQADMAWQHCAATVGALPEALGVTVQGMHFAAVSDQCACMGHREFCVCIQNERVAPSGCIVVSTRATMACDHRYYIGGKVLF